MITDSWKSKMSMSQQVISYGICWQTLYKCSGKNLFEMNIEEACLIQAGFKYYITERRGGSIQGTCYERGE